MRQVTRPFLKPI